MNPFREQRAKALADGAAPVRGAGRFRAEATADGGHIYIYDVIDPWGGYWGISAAEVAQALAGVSGAVTVHLNSPGGDVWEANAIHSTLRQHAGAITMRVDGIAASAASMIMTAGNRVEVAPTAEIMIHDPWTIAIGNAGELIQDAARLERTAQQAASLYAALAGPEHGDADAWRDRMRPLDSWYIGAEEILAAGLAHAVIAENLGENTDQVTQQAEAFATTARAVFACARTNTPAAATATTTDNPSLAGSLALDWHEFQAALKGLAA
jgi:ATP-dependent protease ClpP protease subunit